jgi:hypothetical protein
MKSVSRRLGSIAWWAFIGIGVSDFFLQMATDGRLRIIQPLLASLFG